MGEGGPATAPLEVERWRNLEYSSINAVSFGFLATALLISIFLLIALYERFLRPAPPRRPLLRRRPTLATKLPSPSSPKMSVYPEGVSVLMPGHSIPTFIAHPAPVPCPPERILWPPHHPIPFHGSASCSRFNNDV